MTHKGSWSRVKDSDKYGESYDRIFRKPQLSIEEFFKLSLNDIKSLEKSIMGIDPAIKGADKTFINGKQYKK